MPSRSDKHTTILASRPACWRSTRSRFAQVASWLSSSVVSGSGGGRGAQQLKAMDGTWQQTSERRVLHMGMGGGLSLHAPPKADQRLVPCSSEGAMVAASLVGGSRECTSALSRGCVRERVSLRGAAAAAAAAAKAAAAAPDVDAATDAAHGGSLPSGSVPWPPAALCQRMADGIRGNEALEAGKTPPKTGRGQQHPPTRMCVWLRLARARCASLRHETLHSLPQTCADIACVTSQRPVPAPQSFEQSFEQSWC